MTAARRLNAGVDTIDTLARAIAELRRDLEDLRGTVLARTSGVPRLIEQRVTNGNAERFEIPHWVNRLEISVARRVENDSGNWQNIVLRFNDDSGSNSYSRQLHVLTDGSLTVDQNTAASGIIIGYLRSGAGQGGSLTAIVPAVQQGVRKFVHCTGYATSGSSFRSWTGGGRWNTLARATSVTVSLGAGVNFQAANIALIGSP